MNRFLKFLDTIDKRALFATLVGVALFLGYLYFYSDNHLVSKIAQLMGKSHQSTANLDLYCSKKGNSNSQFCNDKRAEINEKWRDVVVSNSGGRKAKSAFGLK